MKVLLKPSVMRISSNYCRKLETIEATTTVTSITRKTSAFHLSSLSKALTTFRPKSRKAHLFHERRLIKFCLMTNFSTLTNFFFPSDPERPSDQSQLQEDVAQSVENRGDGNLRLHRADRAGAR
jgi:hypothetical protein